MSEFRVNARNIDNSFRGNFLRAISELRQTKVEHIASGVEDYQLWVGYVRALDDVLQMAEDVIERLMND